MTRSEQIAASTRMTWGEYFMKVAETVAERSTCIRRKVGAVAVRDNRILVTGYNGAPSGMPNCIDYPDRCIRAALSIPSGAQHELCHAVHAEQNLIIQAMSAQTTIHGATVYVTCHPCYICTKMLISCGVKAFVVKGDYADDMAKAVLKEAGINVFVHSDKEEEK